MAVNLEELPLPDALPVIPEGWRYESLGDLVEERGVSYGIVQPGSETADGVPIVRVNNIRNGRVDTTDMLKVEAGIEAKFQRSRLRGGEVLLTLVGTLGEVAIVPDNLRGWNVARAVGVIPVRKDPGSLWVSICLRSAFIQHCIRTWATTTVQATFNLRDLAKLPIPIPPRKTREAIAAVLGALDDKIELNRRMNATLEAMARALFQSWFVDFDPVRRNMDRGGKKSSALSSEASAKEDALFPGTFQDSALGHIPKGWTVEPVGEVVACVGGGTPSTAEPKYWEGGTHHWTTPKDFSSLQAPVLLDTDRKLTDAGIAKISSGLLPAGTLLLSSRAPVGYLAIAAMPVAINQGFIALKCNERASNFFMLNWCQANMAEIESRATGTTFAEISKQNFRPIPVVLPPKELMTAFTTKVAPLYDQITANLHQSRTLATLRDTLLPKLLSGELGAVSR
jgi:type I restriction enzyme S subunit